jgi:hypothetical protein
MPYIPQARRNGIALELGADRLDWIPSNAGDLNFLVSTFIANYIRANGLKYAVVNEMIGALECAKMELNRVIIGPYEDRKISENGGVYQGIIDGKGY